MLYYPCCEIKQKERANETDRKNEAFDESR